MQEQVRRIEVRNTIRLLTYCAFSPEDRVEISGDIVKCDIGKYCIIIGCGTILVSTSCPEDPLTACHSCITDRKVADIKLWLAGGVVVDQIVRKGAVRNINIVEKRTRRTVCGIVKRSESVIVCSCDVGECTVCTILMMNDLGIFRAAVHAGIVPDDDIVKIRNRFFVAGKNQTAGFDCVVFKNGIRDFDVGISFAVDRSACISRTGNIHFGKCNFVRIKRCSFCDKCKTAAFIVIGQRDPGGIRAPQLQIIQLQHRFVPDLKHTLGGGSRRHGKNDLLINTVLIDAVDRQRLSACQNQCGNITGFHSGHIHHRVIAVRHRVTVSGVAPDRRRIKGHHAGRTVTLGIFKCFTERNVTVIPVHNILSNGNDRAVTFRYAGIRTHGCTGGGNKAFVAGSVHGDHGRIRCSCNRSIHFLPGGAVFRIQRGRTECTVFICPVRTVLVRTFIQRLDRQSGKYRRIAENIRRSNIRFHCRTRQIITRSVQNTCADDLRACRNFRIHDNGIQQIQFARNCDLSAVNNRTGNKIHCRCRNGSGAIHSCVGQQDIFRRNNCRA